MEVSATLTGRTPLLAHHPRLSDPLDPVARAMGEVSRKRKKTDSDLEELARLEFFGGAYFDETLGPYAPSSWVLKAMNNAGKISKEGLRVLRGVALLDDVLPLVYDGPRTLEALFANSNFVSRMPVRVGSTRVWRVRPRFSTWSISFAAEVADDVLNVEDFVTILERAGRSEGLGDARALGYGRFSAEVHHNGRA
jgi:hypothetical protein